MVANKHISKIIVSIVTVAVIICLLAVGFSHKLVEAMGGMGVTMEYESKLFNTDQIISVDIIMDSDKWKTMLENATSEEYYSCDVIINGTRINNVGIRPKGNTSLSSIANDPDTDRFSFKLEFGQYVEGQTCFGLDKLILNNNFADATNMKEAIIYDMYQYIGADASLYNYAKVSLNGEYWGVYLALEAVESSFMLRNFGTQDGELYKPDSMEMGGGKNSSSSKTTNKKQEQGGNFTPPSNFDPGNMPDMSNFDPGNMPDMSNFDPGNMPDMSNFDPGNMPDMSNFDPGNMPSASAEGSRPEMSSSSTGSSAAEEESSSRQGGGRQGGGPGGGGGFGGFGGGGGANLNYSDDDLDSYSTIWEGEITGTTKADHKRVVTALKNISEGTDLEKYLDVDNILKYMAVHTFSVNMDSLSGNMAHNYYLYEYDGQLNIFPWDYNLSLGGMGMSNSSATEIINDAIDTPFSGTKFFDKLLENEEYLAKYHEYLQKLVDEYVNGGRFDEVYNRIRSQIDTLVETDPTAFYKADEYTSAVQTLYEVIKLRAQSIKGQLEGTIPSTDSGQKEDSSALIDASNIDIKSMGSMNMGGGGDNEGGAGIKRRGMFGGRAAREEGAARQEDRDEKSFTGMPGGPGGGGGFGGFGGGTTTTTTKINNLILMGSGLALMAVAFVIVLCLRRRKWTK
ncbi:MAG: CotH kinase family protein [Lachnospiraceae bacterium]|nr:CotH kinase family protein [Lachnospiraceae bacterium]